MQFFVERYNGSTWSRLTTALESLAVAEAMKSTLAKRHRDSVDNYSILIVADEGGG